MIELNLTPEQLKALGLTDEPVTAESFVTALNAILEKAAGGEQHGQQIADLQNQLTAVTAERDAATAKLREIEDANSLSEVEALLADYDLPEESAAAMRKLATSDREQATAILGGMRKKEAPPEGVKKKEGEAELPPPPVHDPKAPKVATPQEKAAEADKLIAAIRKEKAVFSSYEAARTEARRRKPELFS